MNTQVSALRFFLKTTLGRLDLAHQLARVDYPRKLPRVLSPGGCGPSAGGSAWTGPHVQGRVECGLWRRTAPQRGCCSARLRHRQQADADPRRAGQGTQRPAPGYSPGSCSRSCAPGGCSAARRAGCSRAGILYYRSRTASSTAPATPPPMPPVSGPGSRRTRSGIPSAPISWRPGST